MAVAGRILIMPKGAYDASKTYEMLDLVNYNGSSWLAKKTCKGITPSDDATEYWQNMFDVSSAEIEEIKATLLEHEANMEALEKADEEKLSVTHTIYQSDDSYFCESYKYSDGRMVINMRYDETVNLTNQSGGIYFAAVGSRTFPEPFVSKPTVVVTSEADDGNAFVWGRTQPSPTESPALYAGRGSTAQNTRITIVLQADGRWK